MPTKTSSFTITLFLLTLINHTNTLTIQSKPAVARKLVPVASSNCNIMQKLTREYQKCSKELRTLSQQKPDQTVDNSQIIQDLKVKINMLIEANSDMESDFVNESRKLKDQLESLKMKRQELKVTFSNLDVKVNDLVTINESFKDEADIYMSKNKDIRKQISIYQQKIIDLKRTCSKKIEKTLIGSGIDDSFFS